MARNIEIKARVDNLDALAARVATLTTEGPELIAQELEVVLRDGEPALLGVQEAETLMARLGIEPSQLVETAYVDLLADNAAAGVRG